MHGYRNHRNALFQECQVFITEFPKSTDLENPLDFVIMDNRHHHHIAGLPGTGSRRDTDVILRHLLEQNALALQGALANQGLAQTERIRQMFAALHGIGAT